MTFKPAIWYPIAVVLSVVNLAAAGFAAGQAQPLGQPGVIIGDDPRLGIGQTGDVEGGFRHIDPDEALHTVPHGERSAWPGLADAGSIPGQLFGLSAITTGWRPG